MKPEDEIIEGEIMDEKPTSRGYGYLEPYKDEIFKMRSQSMSFRKIVDLLSKNHKVSTSYTTLRLFFTREIDKKTELASLYRAQIQEQYQKDPDIINEQIMDMRDHVKMLKPKTKEEAKSNRPYLEAQKVLKEYLQLRAKLGTPDAKVSTDKEVQDKVNSVLDMINKLGAEK